MDWEDIVKRHERRINDSLPYQTAVETAARALADPSFHSMLQTQSRMASEAVARAMAAPSFHSMMETQSRIAESAIASLIRSPDIQSTLASLAGITSFAVSKQIAQSVSECGSALAAQMAAMTTDTGTDLLADSVEALLKRRGTYTQELVHSMNTATTVPDEASESFHRPQLEDFTPVQFPRLTEARETATEGYMRRFQEHLGRAKEQIEDSGGRLVVTCKAPGGEEVMVLQVSSADEHFIKVIGIDQFKQRREFTGHHSSIGLAIEVITGESEERQDDDDELIN